MDLHQESRLVGGIILDHELIDMQVLGHHFEQPDSSSEHSDCLQILIVLLYTSMYDVEHETKDVLERGGEGEGFFNLVPTFLGVLVCVGVSAHFQFLK